MRFMMKTSESGASAFFRRRSSARSSRSSKPPSTYSSRVIVSDVTLRLKRLRFTPTGIVTSWAKSRTWRATRQSSISSAASVNDATRPPSCAKRPDMVFTPSASAIVMCVSCTGRRTAMSSFSSASRASIRRRPHSLRVACWSRSLVCRATRRASSTIRCASSASCCTYSRTGTCVESRAPSFSAPTASLWNASSSSTARAR